MDCYLHLKKRRPAHLFPNLYQFISNCKQYCFGLLGPISTVLMLSVYIKMSFAQLQNHSQCQLLCGRDFANERIALQIWHFGLIINKIKQNSLN